MHRKIGAAIYAYTARQAKGVIRCSGWRQGQRAHHAKVRQRPFGAARFTLLFGQLIRELHLKAAVALLLVGREDQDAGQVVVCQGMLLL